MRAGLKARFDRVECSNLGLAPGVQSATLPLRLPPRQIRHVPQLVSLANLAFPGPRPVRGAVDAYATMPV